MIVAGQVWALDVDGCLVDSMTASSLRPYARDVLDRLHDCGATVVLWSAGGREHAAAVAARHGFAGLLAGVYDKVGEDRLTTDHLLPSHVPDVVVDDRPENAPLTAVVVAVPTYMSPDPGDTGLLPLLVELTRTTLQEAS